MAAPVARDEIQLEVIVAATDDGGIGYRGAIPWRLPSDLAHFSRVTRDALPGKLNAVVMGRRTWASLPDRARPLPGRTNIVVSSRPDECRAAERVPPDVAVVSSLDDALAAAGACPDLGRVFVIGGARLYREAMASPRCARIYLTRVLTPFECDVHIGPVDGNAFEAVETGPVLGEGGVAFRCTVYERRDAGALTVTT